MSCIRVHGPAALLPSALTTLCTQIVPRLLLIPELHHHLSALPAEPVKGLWETLAQGSPLHVLLDLLGAPGSGFLVDVTPKSVRHVNGLDIREELLSQFIQRVHLLEVQGSLPYGEGLRVDDFLSGSANGFMKVLKSVDRILKCLEGTYPGLYELPADYEIQRGHILDEFLVEEQEHLFVLRQMNDLANVLSSNMKPCPKVLTNVIMCLSRIEAYQTHLVAHAEMLNDPTQDTAWDVLFSLNHTELYVSGVGSYRSYCSEYPALVDFIDGQLTTSSLNEYLRNATVDLSYLIRCPIEHIAYYPKLLSTLLSLVHPTDEPQAFTSLCSTRMALQVLRDSIIDIGQDVRTSWTIKCLKARSFQWEGPDPAQLGTVLMDDQISVLMPDDVGCELPCSAFLFQRCMLLCYEPSWDKSNGPNVVLRTVVSLSGPLSVSSIDVLHDYPVESWDLGSGVRQATALCIYRAIYAADIKSVEYVETDREALKLVWRQGDKARSITLRFPRLEQMSQWVTLLQQVSPLATIPSTFQVVGVQSSSVSSNEVIYSLAELSSRRTDKARPWSLRARKERTPAPSLFSYQHRSNYPFVTSPSLLPRLFYGTSVDYDGLSSPGSPLSPKELPGMIEPIPTIKLESQNVNISASVPDLTGQIMKTEKFPTAHGGYADVWTATWNSHSGTRKIAVKVLRGTYSDDVSKEKMQRRLHRELCIWQRLNHENVLPLFGTCTDFGLHTSLVCPWYENGSLRKCLQQRGDEFKLSHRLKWLCEIAAGLSYLHAFQIIHGDLSGSNILVNDHGQACLCDFGLSGVIEELMGTSYFTSNLGGAVRWAAPELYMYNIPSAPEGNYNEDGTLRVSTFSDIYSYGSLALEILSGNVPYHYLKSDGQVLIELSKGIKPRRPTSSAFISDPEWGFISECWRYPPGMRPSTTDVSKQIRQLYQESLKRHTI